MDVLPTLRSTVIVLDGLQSGKSRAQLLIVSRGKWGGHEQGNMLHLLQTNAATKAHVIASAWCTISSGPHMMLWVGGWVGGRCDCAQSTGPHSNYAPDPCHHSI